MTQYVFANILQKLFIFYYYLFFFLGRVYSSYSLIQMLSANIKYFKAKTY